MILVLAFVVGSFASYLQASQKLQGSFVWYALAALQAGIVLFGIASSIWGTSVEGIVRSIERWLAERFDKLLATAAGEQVGM